MSISSVGSADLSAQWIASLEQASSSTASSGTDSERTQPPGGQLLTAIGG